MRHRRFKVELWWKKIEEIESDKQKWSCSTKDGNGVVPQQIRKWSCGTKDRK
jgi:hypothetical protein